MTEKPSEPARHYKQIGNWVEQYGNSGAPDQRAAEIFMDCETRESITMLQNELRSVAAGRYKESVMDSVLKPARRSKHGSYEEWARLMLLWISNYKG